LNIYLNELLKNSIDKFKSKWKLLSLKFKQFNIKYKDQSQHQNQNNQNNQNYQNYQNNNEYNIDRQKLIEYIEITCK
jgi:hypothetical protein